MRRLAPFCSALALVLGMPVSAGTVQDVVEVAVVFDVVNRNDSRALCAADGRTYRLRGHLVAPAGALEGDDLAVTVYVHGGYTGERLWHLDSPSNDHVSEMARLGHISLSIDLLGYGASGIPHGQLVCYGSDATVLAEVVSQLRDGRVTPPFARVAMVGLSGGAYRTIFSTSSHADVDAIAVLAAAGGDHADPGPAFETLVLRTSFVPDCMTNLRTKGEDNRGGYYWPDASANREILFHDADPNIIDAFVSAVEAEPCGQLTMGGPGLTLLRDMQAKVGVPVLVGVGEHDPIFPPGAAEGEAAAYTASPDVQAVTFEGIGHLLPLERRAPRFRRVLSDWLRGRGF